MTIRYLNPVQEADVVPASMAPRLSSLEGVNLGLLSNGKAKATDLLAMIGKELNATFKLGRIVMEHKGSAANNCSPELLDDLLRRCDAVITGNGD